jgi:hypothetical protein
MILIKRPFTLLLDEALSEFLQIKRRKKILEAKKNHVNLAIGKE